MIKNLEPKKRSNKLDYSKHKQLFVQFIKTCQNQYGQSKYMIEMQKIANYQSKLIQIYIEDLQEYLRKDQQKQIVKQLRQNTLHFLNLFQEIIAELIPKRNIQINQQQLLQQTYRNILKEQRLNNILRNSNSANTYANNQKIPYKLYQDYDVYIVYGANAKYSSKTITQIKASNIGQLIATRAIVIRVGDCKPQIQIATYACDVCGWQIYEDINKSCQFNPVVQCRSVKCRQNGVSGKITFIPSNSKFKSYQQIKVQQTPQQLQRGAIPKSIKLQIRGNMTNLVSPGDLITIQGIILPKLLNKLKKNLYFQNYFYVTKVVRQKKKYSDFKITQQQIQEIMQTKAKMDLQSQDAIINTLANSIAPEIYGLNNVKKALLYQMAGGITVQTNDNLKIRGQINIALFGDPGIAKSQLLKHISYISPRAVYTTGKGSSGVGLTAAIVADPLTKELSLQAGALVLADMGVCCIDQFDKMQQNDRTAIHEVMQQQTVSITKAGIITSLNARTAVLAAANPIYGRYNRTESTQKNLNLPAALLSRFDLIFILLDQSNNQKDMQLALHIGNVHQKKQAETKGIFNQKFLKNYIALAKQFSPIVQQQIHQDPIIQRYISKRSLQTRQSQQGDQYTTMRSLLAIIRLSQARAKLRFSNKVSKQDVIQCIQIIEQSQQSAKIKKVAINKKYDRVTIIYDLIKDTCLMNSDKKAQIDKIYLKCLNRGFGKDIVDSTIDHYVNFSVFYKGQTHVGIVSM